MRLSELKPCVGCEGPLRSQMAAGWYVIRVTQTMLNPRSINQVAGLAQIFQGHLGLAEVFAPDPDDAIVIMGDAEPKLMDEIHLCYDCMFKGEPLYLLMEKFNKRREKESAELEKAEKKAP